MNIDQELFLTIMGAILFAGLVRFFIRNAWRVAFGPKALSADIASKKWGKPQISN